MSRRLTRLRCYGCSSLWSGLLNAAAGLVVGAAATDLAEGVVLAGKLIDSGEAMTRLEGLIGVSAAAAQG